VDETVDDTGGQASPAPTEAAPTEAIRIEVSDDGVATVSLDRPEVYHAFDSVMCDELSSFWERIKTDDDVRCVILTATGSKAFCTGIDRNGFDDEGFDYDPFTFSDPGNQLGPKSNGCWKPVIGAVNGMACGGAFYMLGECEFLIAADHAAFFDPHVTYGMPAVYEPTLMSYRMPYGEIMRMSLLGTAEHLTAQRAHEIGLVSEVTTGDELLERARWAATHIAANPTIPVQATVRTVWETKEAHRRQAMEAGAGLLSMGFDTASMGAGQARFSSGERIKPRRR